VGTAANDSQGTEFWLTFPENRVRSNLSLFLTGEQDAPGTVTVPGLGFAVSFAVTAGTVTTVRLPPIVALRRSDTIEYRGILVAASIEVTVYGLNRLPFTTDAYLGLPTGVLGTEYLVLDYQNSDIINGTQFAFVAIADATTVTIVPSVTTGRRAAGVPYSFVMNRAKRISSGTQARPLMTSLAASSPPISLWLSLAVIDVPIVPRGCHLCPSRGTTAAHCDMGEELCHHASGHALEW
jgi:hypothetical protein